jgi:hypothetical protein
MFTALPCERLLLAFILVLPVVRLTLPFSSM